MDKIIDIILTMPLIEIIKLFLLFWLIVCLFFLLNGVLFSVLFCLISFLDDILFDILFSARQAWKDIVAFFRKKFKKKKLIFRMAEIYNSHAWYGYPKYPEDKGKLIEMPMESGKIGIYKLIGYEKAWGDIDWGWLIWEFQKYKDEN